MRTVLLALAALLCTTAIARANECDAYAPHVSTQDVPLGCPLLLAVPPSYPFSAMVTVTHYDPQTAMPTTHDVTGAITQDGVIQLPVDESHYVGCDLVDMGPQPQPFNELSIALHDVEVGDILAIATYDPPPHVAAAGPCPDYAAPALECADPLEGCADAGVPIGDPIDPVPARGCNAGRSTGVLALALLALLRRRR